MSTPSSHYQYIPGLLAESDQDGGAQIMEPTGATALAQGAIVVPLTQFKPLVPVVTLPDGYGLLPITLSVAQVVVWTGLGRTKLHELINAGAIVIAKVDGRTLVLTASVLALIERSCRARAA